MRINIQNVGDNIAIPAAVLDLFKNPATTKLLVTSSSNGQPHAIVCGSIIAIDDSTLGVGEILMSTTKANMEANKKIAIEVLDGKSAYEVRGEVIGRATSGPGLDGLNAVLSKMNLKANALWTFKALEVYNESAGPNAGKKIA